MYRDDKEVKTSKDPVPWRPVRVSEVICRTCADRSYTCMRVVTDVVTGEVDPGACVWCRERAVRCGIAVRSYAVGGKKRPRKEGAEGPRKEGAEGPRKKPRSEKSKGKEVDPREQGDMRVILEDDIEEFEEEEESEVQRITEVPVAGGSGTWRETPAERRREPRMGTSGEVQELVNAVKELTEVVREGFREIKEVNRLQRIINLDTIEKIRNRNWRNYERMARREE